VRAARRATGFPTNPSVDSLPILPYTSCAGVTTSRSTSTTGNSARERVPIAKRTGCQRSSSTVDEHRDVIQACTDVGDDRGSRLVITAVITTRRNVVKRDPTGSCSGAAKALLTWLNPHVTQRRRMSHDPLKPDGRVWLRWTHAETGLSSSGTTFRCSWIQRQCDIEEFSCELDGLPVRVASGYLHNFWEPLRSASLPTVPCWPMSKR
jgi:hypothetical protein